MKFKITENTDSRIVNIIREGLAKKDGHCPCILETTPDTRCMCKAFREQKESGWCHCRLYYKDVTEQ